MRLEDLQRDALVRGIVAGGAAVVLDVRWHGGETVEVTYRDHDGHVGQRLLYRDDEAALGLEERGRAWSFDGDGALLRLVSEALRIRNAHLFDPYLAVTTSMVEPLPHQITAVYGELLPRHPLRFLLADDPGAGKTIMAGLYIRELLARGDVERCLVVCPGSLGEQWQDELYDKFHLEFDIVSRQDFETARQGNPFLRKPLVICRLDQLSRNEDLQRHLAHEEIDWDLVIVDEAHKMSAHWYGNELKKTKRFQLGETLGELARHFLLMTATPHNGKEDDFQVFLGLLDADRFEGRYREGHHQVDASDLMRRMIKEDLVWADGRKLFPERRAYTVAYRLSRSEADLYEAVTTYVREEMNRADQISQEEGSGKRRNVVGFALTTLQRRLASSPAAIHRSLERRRNRLESRCRELKLLQSGSLSAEQARRVLLRMDVELPEDLEDLEDLPEEELFDLSEQVLDQATAARTIDELEAEIGTLRVLEDLALKVKAAGVDSKWREVSSLLQDDEHMFDDCGHRRKLIVFTEHRDTLDYLAARIRALLGRQEAVVTIRGGMPREARRTVQELFLSDPQVQVLVATDAAGEGVNLQRAHLMINYDLPWNPNRLEQRFGRIHRIGQQEVCHCWNLVAENTREGDVYLRLFTKLQAEREALDGKVFDVLGKAFAQAPLRDLLLEAIRYGDSPEVKARLEQVIDGAVDPDHLERLLTEDALANDVLDTTRIQKIREDMDRANARRLQPHFVAEFFLEAFRRVGGRVYEREPRRYEVTRVPAELRTRDRLIGAGAPVLQRYERITFHKEAVPLQGSPTAQLVTPGHPLLRALIDVTLDRFADVLRRGAVLVDENDPGETARALAYLEHSIRDGRSTPSGEPRVVSRRLQFVEAFPDGTLRAAGPARYLDFRPVTDDERVALDEHLRASWLGEDLEAACTSFAISELVPEHLDEVRRRTVERIDKTETAVRDRLTTEIAFWDRRAEELRLQEQAGRQPRMNWQRARNREQDLQRRLRQRLAELERERSLSALPPRVIGGALVVPQGLVDRALGRVPEATPPQFSTLQREKVERLAVDAVLAAERALGRQPTEMPHNNPGYDVESRDPATGRLLFIEVKGRAAGAPTVTVTKTEILASLNAPDQWILALVEVDGDRAAEPRYLMRPFSQEPDFATTSVNFDLSALMEKARSPSASTGLPG